MMGKVGLPAPVSELAGRDWDAVIVGGGHNGLTAAAYLARGGCIGAGAGAPRAARRRLHAGAPVQRSEATWSAPAPTWSACSTSWWSEELELRRHGYSVVAADPNLWCPFPDGTSLAEFLDDEPTARHMRENGFSERDIAGLPPTRTPSTAAAARSASAPAGTWVGPSPSRAELEQMLGDPELISIVFEESIASHDRPLRGGRAAAARALRPGSDRRLGRASGPGHRIGEADAPPGRPAGPGPRLGLRRGRHGPGLLRYRAGGAGGGRAARRRRRGRRGRSGGGGASWRAAS